MSVIKTEHSTYSSIGEALVSAGFATSYSTPKGYILYLNIIDHKYPVLAFIGNASTYCLPAVEYGTISNSVFTSNYQLTVHEDSTGTDGSLTFKLYYDVIAGWFAINIMSSTGVNCLFYQGKLDNGDSCTFFSTTYSVYGYQNTSPCHGVLFSQSEDIPVIWAGLGNICKINGNYVVTDLLVKTDVSRCLIMNNSVPATVVGLKWIGANSTVETQYGDIYYIRYIKFDYPIPGSIFIPFG